MSSSEPFANLVALDFFVNLILIAILMPKKCNLTEVYSFSIKVEEVASYRLQRWEDRNLWSSRIGCLGCKLLRQ